MKRISMLVLLFTAFNLIHYPGCTLTGSFYVDKQWNTYNPDVFENPDLTTRFELKVTKDFDKAIEYERRIGNQKSAD